jgi:tetratricopeptide (TPR) repeat protein
VSDKPDVDRLVDRGVQDLSRAVEIAPQRASAWNMLSVYQYRKLSLLDAYNAARKAYEADAYLTAAQEVVWRLYATSYDMEQFVDAVRWCGEGRARFPSDNRFVLCEIWLMSSPARDPDIPEAWRLVGELEKITPKHTWEYKRREAQIAVAAALARAGLADSARHVLERSRADGTIDPRKELLPSEAYARIHLGEPDQAIALLEQYVAANPGHRAGFARASAWRWRPLQTHPRFRELVALGR